MCAFETLLASISERPGMYVGQGSLRAVSVYLDGYCHALTDNGHPDPLSGWRIWVYHKFLIWHPAWHWTRVLLHVYGSDRGALIELPSLYAEFATARDLLDADATEADLRRQLTEKYGRDWYEPEVTHTAFWG